MMRAMAVAEFLVTRVSFFMRRSIPYSKVVFMIFLPYH